jgi:hypothetical protein
MESLLRLNKEQNQRKIARQKRQRRLFWTVGLILIVIQATIAIRASRSKPAAVVQSPDVTATLPAQTMQAAAITTTPSPALASQPAMQPPDLPTRRPLPSTTLTALPTKTPDTPASPTPQTSISEPTQPVHPDNNTFLSTGYGVQSVTPDPAQSFFSLTLLAPPEWIAEQTFELSGTGHPGKIVSVLYNHSLIAQTEINQDGTWQANIPTAPLARGKNAFVVSTIGTNIPTVNTSDVSSDDSQLVFFDTTFSPWWLDAPLRLQASLGEGYACAPTVLGVAMDFYHRSNNNYPAPATVELVQALTKNGFISGYGADAQMVCNLAIAYGYSHSFFYQEWSQAHVRQMLDAGHPVIANVRVGLSTDGYGHSVLLIGLSHDGQRVMLIDPAQGMVEISWTQFDRSWASFGPPYRHGTVVMP